MCDEETGQLYLIDVNPRLAPGVIFGHYAGSDLLGAYVDMLLGVHPGRSPRPGRGPWPRCTFSRWEAC